MVRAVTAGDRFLAAFNEIESYFRRTLQVGDHVEFAERARTYANRKRLPRAQRDALSACTSTRNAISHGRYYAGRPITELVSDVIDQIERLRDQLPAPPRALNVLTTREICTAHPDEPVTVALRHVLRFDYSQLPVDDGDRYVGSLTTNALARWLADQLAKNDDLAESQSVQRVLEFAEAHERAVHVAKTITAADAVDRLSSVGGSGRPLAALIITETGRSSEKPLAVVVGDDLPALTAALSFA
jgi:CBS domain-containing protein